MFLTGLSLGPQAEDWPWRPTRDQGVSWIPLHLDPKPDEPGRRGGATVLIRMEPGCAYAAHRHLGSEDVLVLQGGYRDGEGSYHQGQHVHYPPGSAHAPRALGDPERPIDGSNPACILYAHVPGGIELLGRS